MTRERTSEAGEPLPVLRAAEEIVRCMQGSRGMVLTAATGSGKTTQVPQILARAGCVQGQIVVLEPRRLAARMTARRVAEEMGAERRPLGKAELSLVEEDAERIRCVDGGVEMVSDPCDGDRSRAEEGDAHRADPSCS